MSMCTAVSYTHFQPGKHYYSCSSKLKAIYNGGLFSLRYIHISDSITYTEIVQNCQVPVKVIYF